MSPSRIVTLIAVSVAAALIASEGARAESRLTLGLFGGLGLPEKSLIDASAPVEGVGENPPDNFVFLKQRGTLAFGVRADYWIVPRIGIEGEVSFLSSKADLRAAFFDPETEVVNFGVLSESAKSTHFGLLINYAVIQPALDPLKVYLSAGLGAVNHSGTAFSNDFIGLKGGTDVGFVMGVGLQYSVGASLAVRADLRDYITSYDPEVADTGSFYQSRTQHDLMFNVGLDFSVMK